jgi:uncharacterized membrane protein YdjX (TVP38/TMEM64 family)
MFKKNMKLIKILLFVVVLIFVLKFFNVTSYLNLEYFLTLREDMLALGVMSIFIIIGLYAVVSIAYLPIAYLSIFSGYLFGWAEGGAVAYTGAVINMLLSFLWARYIFKDYFVSLREKSSKLDGITQKLNENGTSFIFYARLFFLTPYNSLNIIGGISDIPWKPYILASAAGATLQAVFYTYAGSRLNMIASKSDMIEQGLQLSIVAILFFSLIHFAKKRITSKETVD